MNRKRRRNRITRILERFLTKLAVVFVFIGIGVLYWGEKNIQALALIAENPEVDKEYIYAERKPVDECVKEYIDSLPMPEMEIEYEIETNIDTTENNEQVYMPYTEEDVEFLAQTMYAEEGKFFAIYKDNLELVEKVHKLAGSVVIHRADNEYRDATTIQQVVFTKGQYAEQTQERVREGQEMPDIVYVWAEELLRDGPIGPNNLIYQSESQQGDQYGEPIGNQYFGTEPSLPREK